MSSKVCPICSGRIAEGDGTKRGRPQKYCGIPCRRIAEFELKRVNQRIGRLEQELEEALRDRSGLRDSRFMATAEERQNDIARELARALDRLRELVEQ